MQATYTYSFRPRASDDDSSTLVFSIENKPSWAAFSTSTGLLSGTPGAEQTGSYPGIVISVSDGSLTASLPAFAITVEAPPNEAPRIEGAPSSSVEAGSAYQFQPTAEDPDGNALTFSIRRKPSWASFSTATGRLSGIPGSESSGSYTGIVISVSDGSLSSSLPAFTIDVTGPSNAAPSIGGTPPTTIAAGSPYQFRPTAEDPENATLAFSISRKPGWATFSTATGRLTGTPDSTQAGDYSNIVISVSDGTNVVALPAFTIRVAAGTPAGEALLSWDASTVNTDGSRLTNLVGYRVYHGSSADSLTPAADVPAGTMNYLYGDLSSGTHYFAVTAVNSGGVESPSTPVGSKTIP